MTGSVENHRRGTKVRSRFRVVTVHLLSRRFFCLSGSSTFCSPSWPSLSAIVRSCVVVGRRRRRRKGAAAMMTRSGLLGGRMTLRSWLAQSKRLFDTIEIDHRVARSFRSLHSCRADAPNSLSCPPTASYPPQRGFENRCRLFRTANCFPAYLSNMGRTDSLLPQGNHHLLHACIPCSRQSPRRT
jgi:hypothetical protein